MFFILTDPDKKDGGWDQDEFFEKGQLEIDAVLDRLGELGVKFNRTRALDFGCGVGRLTQALAAHFRWTVGVDASGEMVKLAKGFASERGCNKVGFRANVKPNLALFQGGTRDGFDFIYSVITLQHMPQDLQYGYVTEFVRVLRRGGVAVFQIPEGQSDFVHSSAWLSMFPTARETVEGWVSETGGKLLDVEVSEHGGEGWTGWRYVVTKP
jgi:SAM-dependent methyltransferase